MSGYFFSNGGGNPDSDTSQAEQQTGEAESASGGTVTEEGLAQIEAHLASLDHSPANDAMMARLKAALADGGRIDGAEATYYEHELLESNLMSKGMEQQEAHLTAFAQKGVSPFSVYHPEVIKQFPELFNQAWRDFWGI